MNKNLVICCAGDNSLHKNWLLGDKPEFDLVLLYYGDAKENEYSKDCIKLVKEKGFKFQLKEKFINSNWDLIKQYEYICFSDDDLLCQSNCFNNLFKRMKEYDIWMAQPALTWDSYINHPHLKQDKSSILRYTSFVEIMVFAFKLEILDKIKFSITDNYSGWGFEYVWYHLLGYPKDKFAIIDEYPIKHTKPFTGKYPEGIDPHADWRRIAKKFNYNHLPMTIYETIRKPMKKITFCIPSKNNLRYLKACIPSIRKNSFRNDHDIFIFVDKDEDGTVEWLESIKNTYNIKYFVNPNINKSLFGIGKAYDYCIEKSETEIFMIFHADMMLGKHADFEAYKYLEPSKVVCSTRIEPPLHPEGVEKIVKDFGLWPELNIKDGFRELEFDQFVEETKLKYKNKITHGCFAPWMMYKKDFMEIGMHDPIMKSAREDSDVFNRMVLNGYELIQSWESLVYHLTCRGGQFEHGVLTKDHSQKSKDWQKLMHYSTLEFIRKWGSTVKYDEYLNPLIKNKYNIGFVIKNCNLQLISYLEPWCNTLYSDYNNLNLYIQENQPHTSFDLNTRLKPINEIKNNDIIIEFDGSLLNQERYLFLTEQLSDILKESAEIGEMEYDIFKLTVQNLNTYQQSLIKL